jgi:hypothetical protein
MRRSLHSRNLLGVLVAAPSTAVGRLAEGATDLELAR